jgi:TRAP-type C4-dicarboxylate transport system substrate-binding protein
MAGKIDFAIENTSISIENKKRGSQMKKRVFFCSVACILTILAFFLMCQPVQAQDKVIKLKYANFIPPAHKNAVLSEQWCKEIEKRTNGRVKITHFGGGTLVSAPQIYDSTVKGICDIGHSVVSYTSGRFPLSEVVDLPLGYASGIQATRLVNAFYKKFKPKEFDDTEILYMHAHGPGYFHTKKVIASLDDIKGMRIKSTGISSKIVQAIGGVPVTMPIPETYDALQKGLADGVLLNTDTLKSLRFGDYCHCTIENNGLGYTISFFVTMNKEKWNSLPPDIQNIFREVSEEYAEKMGQAWDDADKEAKEFVVRKGGHKFVTASKEEVAKAREKMKPIISDYVRNIKAKNLPGEEALKFCQDWLQANP